MQIVHSVQAFFRRERTFDRISYLDPRDNRPGRMPEALGGRVIGALQADVGGQRFRTDPRPSFGTGDVRAESGAVLVLGVGGQRFRTDPRPSFETVDVRAESGTVGGVVPPARAESGARGVMGTPPTRIRALCGAGEL